jgi:hypothetical protein
MLYFKGLNDSIVIKIRYACANYITVPIIRH